MWCHLYIFVRVCSSYLAPFFQLLFFHSLSLPGATAKAALWCVNLQAQAAAPTVCRGDLHVLFLGEDWDAWRLKDSDLHKSAVRLHWFPVIISYHIQLQWAREKTYKHIHMRSKHKTITFVPIIQLTTQIIPILRLPGILCRRAQHPN